MSEDEKIFFDPPDENRTIASALVAQIAEQHKLEVFQILYSQLGVSPAAVSRVFASRSVASYSVEASIALPATRERCFALLVGIGCFQDNSLDDPEYTDEVASNDIALIKKTLVERCRYSESNISIFTNKAGTPENIKNWFVKFINRQEMAEQVIVYLSSHGRKYVSGQHSAMKDLKYCFVAYDSSAQSMKAEGIGALTPEELLKWLNGINAGEKILFVDTCFSGHILLPDRIIGNHAYLLSCAADQLSYVHTPDKISIFTKFVAEGLSEAAWAKEGRRGRRISVTGLHEYLHPAVKQAAMRIKDQPQETEFRLSLSNEAVWLV